MADAPVGPTRREQGRERRAERVERARLTTRRLFGLDRSGPPPPETLAGQPLHPWTIPNAIGFVRLALIPVFLLVAFDTPDGHTALGAAIFAVIGWTDYLDGIAARVTGQYSRLGTLLDPLTDRLLIVCGVAVCWHYELLPRWALAVLVGREVFMLALARFGLKRGIELKINWPGRLGVWWVMAAPFWAMVGVDALAKLGLYVGLAHVLVATVMYLRDGMGQLRDQRSATAS
ncbi:MAG: CDP-alcohol phosphatidyltransferase family protein [Actinomycetota bacterium]|nr:CDP-alcohol phosphatidyltransferase family protein [Actinomycetota bacterium]